MLKQNNNNIIGYFTSVLSRKYLFGNCVHCPALQQSTNSKAANDAYTEKNQEKNTRKKRMKPMETLKKYVPEEFMRVLRFERRNVPPTTLAFVDEQAGPEQTDVDIPLDKIIKEMPSYAVSQTEKLAQICRDHVQYFHNNPDFQTDLDGAAHAETIIQYQFRTDSDMQKWKYGSDSDSAQGFSKCDLYKSDRGTAIFEGVLSKRLVKDGRAKRAGWCGMKSIDTNPFAFKKHYTNWIHYTHLIIKCRGDGRSYKVILHTPGPIDVTFGDSYSYPLHTHGGPYWQYELIPFSRFIYTINGRIMDEQSPLYQFDISSIGIVQMDKIEGPFRLEIDFIGAYKDISHMEDFAYEFYNLPAVSG